VKGTIRLKCRECGREHPPIQAYACEDCFGPLDVVYDYDQIHLNKSVIQSRPRTLWRYFNLLPIEDPSNIVDLSAGWTPLHKSRGLAEFLGLKNLYIKNDTVNPTYSFKDRPASIAVSKTLEFGAKAIGCASTGNLAAAIAAHAAKAGIKCYVFIPRGVEASKIAQTSVFGAEIIAIKGTYDDANRLAAQAAEAYGLILANINIRPYYVEGSKTLTYEVCEQLNWNLPDHVIVPAASGALVCATSKAFKELQKLNLVKEGKVKISLAQPGGCSPIVDAFKSGANDVTPVEKPDTIAKSLAIGDPGDGIYALRVVRESGGTAEYATNEEIIEATLLLAKTEGIYAEPAGSITVAVLKKLVETGKIAPDDVVVCYVTGSGLKTPEIIVDAALKPIEIEPTLRMLEKVIKKV